MGLNVQSIKPIYESPKVDLDDLWQAHLAEKMWEEGCFGLSTWLRNEHNSN